MAQLGYRAAPGQPNRMISPAGETVTRASYRNAVAHAYGYKNDLARRGHASGDRNYINAHLNTEQGRRDLTRAQELGRTREQYGQELIAARNGRPHPGSNNPGNQAYHDFIEDYEYEDYEPIEVDY